MNKRVVEISFLCLTLGLFVGSAMAWDGDKVDNTTQAKLNRIPETHFELHGVVHDYLCSFTKNWLIGIAERNPMILEMYTEKSKEAEKDLLPWSGEFAGKYLTSAVQVLRLTGDEELKAYLANFVDKLVGLQTESGYLGAWSKEYELTNKAYSSKRRGETWDTWNHYHVMLGLLMWYEDTHDMKSLKAAEKIGDLLCEKFSGQPGKLAGSGNPTMNLAPVHSLCLLYRVTGKTAYLELAKQIVEKELPLTGDYVQTALAGKEFYQTPLPRWEGLHQIMGVAELYEITGEEKYRKAFEHIWWSIVKLDRHNTGGFSSGEKAQGNPYHQGAIETCCTVAWGAMSVEMLRLTADSVVADELELTFWNATLASLSKSGKWSTYNTPMEGKLVPNTTDIAFQIRPGSEELNCCSVNAPRGLGMVSDWAVMADKEGLVLNWYGPSSIQTQIENTSITLEQQTNYPRTGNIKLSVSPEEAKKFTLKLRIPHWSKKTRITVNGQKIEGVAAGSYLTLNRKWEKGDTVEIDLDMSLHYWVGERESEGKASIYRGPILLAYNTQSNGFADIFSKPWKRFGKSYCCKEIGTSVEYEFVGDSFKWIGKKFDDAGKALVEIDGKKVAIVDQYGPTRGEAFFWEHKGVGSGKHRAKLTILDKKNPASRDHWINVTEFNNEVCDKAIFDAKTIAPELINADDANSIIALNANTANGNKVTLLDFESAGEKGSTYRTWFKIDNIRKRAFARENPSRSSRLVDSVDLTINMDLGGQCLLAWLNPKADYAPTGGWNVPHDIGRWWDAILRLEDHTGFVIPAKLEDAMLHNLDVFTDNPDRILLAPEGLDWVKPYFELHSTREGFLSLAALVKYRHSQWAKQRGHEMLERLLAHTNPDGTLDVEKYDAFKYVLKSEKNELSHMGGGDRTAVTGRAIDGLMSYYKATHDPLALEIARRFSEYHMKHTVNPDGSIPEKILKNNKEGHSHSYMGTLRGLLLYGLEAGRRDIIDTVAATYRKGVKEHVITESGWNGHDLGCMRFVNSHGERVTETATAGDAAQLALWLALRAGQTDLLDDVERLLRARLLPAQITSGGPKQLGGWGVYGNPHTRGGCILDVAAAVVHTLIDINDHVMERTDKGIMVNLHLNRTTEYADVSCRRSSEGVLTVLPRVRDNLYLRVPGWTDREKLRLTINGAEISPNFVDGYVRIPEADIDPGDEVVMRYDLPIHETTEKTDVGRVFRFRWQGDKIIGIDPHEGDENSLYPALKN